MHWRFLSTTSVHFYGDNVLGYTGYNMSVDDKITPLDAFTMLFRTLTYTGYFVPVPEPKNAVEKKLHSIYRLSAVVVLLVYDLQQFIFIYQVFGDVHSMIDGLSVLFTAVNVTIKVIAVNLNADRFYNLHAILNDKIFSARSTEDKEYLHENKENLSRLSRYINRIVFVIIVCWFITPILKKLDKEDVVFPVYFPFNTDNWLGFICADAYISLVMCWIGYGHMTLNVLICGYYSQVRVQLRIIKYHLQNLTDDDKNQSELGDNSVPIGRKPLYKDEHCKNYHYKFVHLIKRYDKSTWFTYELQSIMDKAMLVQFFSSTFIICTVVFKMTGLPFNTGFIYVILYLACLLLELFLYCYYGSLLEYESKTVNDAVYQSQWTSLSPKFRRQIIIAMLRWTRPISPSAAGFVAISLNTFVVVLRGSYTMYTILKTS